MKEVTKKHNDHDVTLKDLSKDKDLEAALSFLKGTHLDFLDNQSIHTTTSDQKIQGKSNVQPLFLIPDFISKPNASSSPSTDRDKVKRVEDVTAAQWISANSKIIIMKVDCRGDEHGRCSAIFAVYCKGRRLPTNGRNIFCYVARQ